MLCNMLHAAGKSYCIDIAFLLMYNPNSEI